MFGTFIGLSAAAEGFSKDIIGLLMSATYAGLVLGTLRCGRLINRVGHIRSFAAFSTGIAVVILTFPFVKDPWVWLALRVVMGFNTAGLYMVAESWLMDRATGETRGTVLSIYMMISYLGIGCGQLLIGFNPVVGETPFMIAAILVALALLPVSLTRSDHPPPIDVPYFPFRRLYEISPVAVIGCTSTGLVTGGLFGMGAIFAQEIGLDLTQVSQFMAAVITSGLLLQLPAGRLSDHFNRRNVIIWVALATAIAALLVVLVMYLANSGETLLPFAIDSIWINHWLVVPLLACLFSALQFTIYPLCVAYANDFLEPVERVQASGGLVLAYGLGAAAGPVLVAFTMKLIGPQGLFLFSGIAMLLLVLFASYRTRQRSWAKLTPKDPFIILPRATTTPIPTELEPHSFGEQLVLDLQVAGEHEYYNDSHMTEAFHPAASAVDRRGINQQ